VGAARHGQRLPMRLGLEGCRAHVGDPDLDRAQAALTQTLAVRWHLIPRRPGPARGCHADLRNE
jgi:hypothetical protein